MSVLERLKAARELLSDEGKWIKGEYARDSFGNSCPSIVLDAQCFCVLGANHYDLHRDAGIKKALYDALPDFEKLPSHPDDDGYEQVTNYNDHPDTTHADILALLDRAIEAKEDEK